MHDFPALIRKHHETLVSAIAQLRDSSTVLRDSKNEPLSLERELSNDLPSINGIFDRLYATAELVRLVTSTTPTPLTPTKHITSLADAVVGLQNILLDISNDFSELKNRGGVKNFDDPPDILTSVSGDYNMPIVQKFYQLALQIDDVQIFSHSLTHLLAPHAQEDTTLFSVLSIFTKYETEMRQKIAGNLEEVLSELSQARGEIQEIRVAINDNAKEVKTDLDLATSSLGEINRLKSETEIARKSTTEYESEATAKIALLREVTADAENLRVQVVNYKAQFLSFQDELERHLKKLGDVEIEQKARSDALNSSAKRIRDLVEQAEQMLSGATTAGLASSFGARKKELTAELKKSIWMFYVSIFILLITAMPLFLYVLNFDSIGIVAQIIGIDAEAIRAYSKDRPIESDIQSLSELLVRAALLVPGVWLAQFTARRQARLFKLREHYSFKYSIASSVDGFKRQVGQHAEDVVAKTFNELMFNPAERMELRGGDEHPSAVLAWGMRKLGITADGKQE
ncbi:MAG: hypothetical protein WD673_13860 [Alphaproteobacteria bacterium]